MMMSSSNSNPLINDGKKTVEDYLNQVNYGDINEYVPSDFALKMINIIKLIEGGDPENKSPVVHMRMLDNFVAAGLDTINMCHRGIAKTTLKEYLIWYIAIFNKLPNLGKVPYALYVSDSMDNGVKKMRKSLDNRYENSPFLQQMIPEIKFTDNRWEFKNAEGRKFVVTGHGAKSGVRGTRENNSRPVLALLDDLLSDDDARSPTVLESIEETVYNAIEFALHPNRRKVIWSGTPFHANDPLYKAVESGAWAVNVYPVCEEFPCTEAEFKGSWEDRFTYQSLTKTYLKMRDLGKLDAFNQELMLRIMSDEDRLINMKSEVRWYKRSDLIKNKESYNFYITTDWATSEKKSADFSVTSVWAINSKGAWFYVDGACKKQTLDKSLDDLFKYVQIYSPLSVGIEVTGQQGGFIKYIESEMMKKNIFFNFASQSNGGAAGIRPSSQKFTRFLTMLPMFKQQMMYFPEELKDDAPLVECMNELSLVAHGGFKSKHDDFIDTISMLSMMDAWKPSENVSMVYDSSGIWIEDDEEVECSYGSYIV